LVNLNEGQWLKIIENLRDVKLIAPQSKHNKDTLDCHPLVREHFGDNLQQNSPEAWLEAHGRLYDYYKNQPEKEYPDTLAEMEPLFAAVAHGCLVGKHQDVMDTVFTNRICRKNEFYLWRSLGAFGANLAALSSFFEAPFCEPAPELTSFYQASVLNWAGVSLIALGLLQEAIEPMQASLSARIKQKNWKESAIDAGNLSSLYLTLGQVQQAVDYATQSYDFSERSDELIARYYGYCYLALVLHQSDDLAEAEDLFRRVELLHKEENPSYHYLYGAQGFYFCDLLLSRGHVQEVLERAGQTLEWAKAGGIGLLPPALDTLSLGRAHFLQTFAEGSTDYSKAEHYFNKAVTGLRKSGDQDMLPSGLLARAALYRVKENFPAAWEDLNEAKEIAERGEMGLFLADFHLEACRLHLAQQKAGDSFVPESAGAQYISPNPKNHLEAAKGHLKTAKEMINKMGYHRRDPELADLRSQIAKIK